LRLRGPNVKQIIFRMNIVVPMYHLPSPAYNSTFIHTYKLQPFSLNLKLLLLLPQNCIDDVLRSEPLVGRTSAATSSLSCPKCCTMSCKVCQERGGKDHNKLFITEIERGAVSKKKMRKKNTVPLCTAS
jgi:hypothetical protein